MHINVRDILIESVGYSRTYKISGERPELKGVRLTQDIEGEITISRLEESLLASGRVSTEIELECHRCLRTFACPTRIFLRQEYAKETTDDQLPIADEAIDLAPLIEQEIILSLPIKVLCRPECPGLDGISGKYTTPPDLGARLQARARITKGP
jgi:uncharacterized protein